MPGFVRTKADEAKWKTAKDAAAKETERGSEGFWKLSNYIFHKNEGNHEVAEFFKAELMKFGGMGQLSLGEGAQKPSVKSPRAKGMPGPGAKPSVFFKSEDVNPKHPSLQKLRDFIVNRKVAKQSI
jgi:hypothetical protein